MALNVRLMILSVDWTLRHYNKKTASRQLYCIISAGRRIAVICVFDQKQAAQN